MSAQDLTLALLLGLGLSASTGLNTFLPLLLLSGAARFGIMGIELNEKFRWLGSDTAIVILIIAAIVEIIADKIPAVDHFLDGIGTFLRPAAGLLAMASVLSGLDPVTAAVIGLIIGSPLSLGLHTLKAGTRAASSVTTFGCANPLLSVIEDIVSVGVSLIAIFAPVLVPVIVLVVIVFFWRLVRRINAERAAVPRSTA